MPEMQEYDEKGQLTSDGMRLHLGQKRVILHAGKVIEHESQIPSDAELAKGDEKRKAAVRSQLQAQIAQLQSQMALTEAKEDEDQARADQTITPNGVDPGVATPLAPDGTLLQGTAAPTPLGSPDGETEEQKSRSKRGEAGTK